MFYHVVLLTTLPPVRKNKTYKTKLPNDSKMSSLEKYPSTNYDKGVRVTVDTLPTPRQKQKNKNGAARRSGQMYKLYVLFL